MDRQPVVAGSFYPGDSQALSRHIRSYLTADQPAFHAQTILTMLPHAGYIYSGAVAGTTLAQANLPATVILLGPSHTGDGAALGLWPDGSWLFPGGDLTVDQSLATTILAACPRIQADYTSHLREHSLEVQIPFLHAVNPHMQILPITIADPRLDILLEVGRALAQVISKASQPIGLLVSSDMSHYISAAQAKVLDHLAIQAITALSPEQLYTTVRDNRISMCGVLPMTAGLTAACELGAERARLIQYTTSGEVTGDDDQVVGYAGMVVEGRWF
ncbi:MAG: AmmeMemoRadiSam system protein B [Deltaproteobacteria bacterium]|nr:MAG: AmmeMemoRadiSam system protein B [Deltaproteobacteria bacterium]